MKLTRIVMGLAAFAANGVLAHPGHNAPVVHVHGVDLAIAVGAMLLVATAIVVARLLRAKGSR